MTNNNDDLENSTFIVFAESKEYDHPLLMTGLTFARLIDDVVVPYEENDSFFIDGVPVNRGNVKKIKIVREDKGFLGLLNDLHWKIRRHEPKDSKILADQYHVRVEALIREGGKDVTSQIIKAYNTAIKPKLTEYITKRQELITTALKLFIEGIKSLGGV